MTDTEDAVVRRSTLEHLRVEAGRGFIVIVAGVILSASSSILFAKLLSAEEFGIYVFTITLLNYGVIVARGGMSSSAVRYVNEYLGRDPDRLSAFVQWARRSLINVNAVMILVAVCAGLLASLFQPRYDLFTFFAAIAGLAPLSFVYFHSALLRAEKKIVPSQLPLSVFRPLLALFFASMVWTAGFGSGTTFAVSEVLGIALLVYPLTRLTRHLGDRPTSFVPPCVRRDWRNTTVGITFAELSQQLIGQVDILLVGLYFGMAEAGIYGIATRLSKLVVIGNRAANSIAGPMIAESYHGGDFRTLQDVVSQTCILALAATIVLSLGLAVVPSDVYAWLGDGFSGSRRILLILLAGQCINAAAGPVGLVLILTGHQTDQTLVNLVFGLFLAFGIYLTSHLGGDIAHVAVLFSIALASANLTKAVLVYFRTGIKSLPLPRS